MAQFGRSILILAAHPDDEVAACAAAVGRARASGGDVWVIYLTNGCLDRETVWPWDRRRHPGMIRRRRAEAERAAAALGLECAGWGPRAARHLWRELPEAECEVRAAVQAHGIDQLWSPAYEGGNPDHDALNALASRFMDAGLSVLEFAEYNFTGGRPRSHSFPRTLGTETVIELAPDEQKSKRQALSLYASERGNLRVIGLEREVFRPLPEHDYSRAPHPNKLWYTRFQWVPFRHPRIDFVKPQAVYHEIGAYIDRSRGLEQRSSAAREDESPKQS